jgi:hypothetical protein
MLQTRATKRMAMKMATYKSLPYVRGECERLAAQLAAIGDKQ